MNLCEKIVSYTLINNFETGFLTYLKSLITIRCTDWHGYKYSRKFSRKSRKELKCPHTYMYVFKIDNNGETIYESLIKTLIHDNTYKPLTR